MPQSIVESTQNANIAHSARKKIINELRDKISNRLQIERTALLSFEQDYDILKNTCNSMRKLITASDGLATFKDLIAKIPVMSAVYSDNNQTECSEALKNVYAMLRNVPIPVSKKELTNTEFSYFVESLSEIVAMNEKGGGVQRSTDRGIPWEKLIFIFEEIKGDNDVKELSESCRVGIKTFIASSDFHNLHSNLKFILPILFTNITSRRKIIEKLTLCDSTELEIKEIVSEMMKSSQKLYHTNVEELSEDNFCKILEQLSEQSQKIGNMFKTSVDEKEGKEGDENRSKQPQGKLLEQLFSIRKFSNFFNPISFIFQGKKSYTEEEIRKAIMEKAGSIEAFQQKLLKKNIKKAFNYIEGVFSKISEPKQSDGFSCPLDDRPTTCETLNALYSVVYEPHAERAINLYLTKLSALNVESSINGRLGALVLISRIGEIHKKIKKKTFLPHLKATVKLRTVIEHAIDNRLVHESRGNLVSKIENIAIFSDLKIHAQATLKSAAEADGAAFTTILNKLHYQLVDKEVPLDYKINLIHQSADMFVKLSNDIESSENSFAEDFLALQLALTDIGQVCRSLPDDSESYEVYQARLGQFRTFKNFSNAISEDDYDTYVNLRKQHSNLSLNVGYFRTLRGMMTHERAELNVSEVLYIKGEASKLIKMLDCIKKEQAEVITRQTAETMPYFKATCETKKTTATDNATPIPSPTS